MDHYKQYSVENFVEDFRFRAWVKNPSQEEEMCWQNWIRENPHQRIAIEEARAIVLAIHPIHTESISDFEIQHEVRNILSQINDEEAKKAKPVKVALMPRFLKIAASLAIILLAGWYGVRFLYNSDSGKEEKPTVLAENYMIEHVNKTAIPVLINLPDKSSVLLAPNSLIRCTREFTGKKREVILEGTAFFEVTKNPDRPFYVKAGDIVAKVLGTSFEVSTNPADKEIRVVVKTGTVCVYSDPDDQKTLDDQPNVVLTKNEQLVYKGDASELQHTRLDSSSIEELRVPDTYLKFRSTPVATVFAALSKAYGVKINYENAEIQGCSVTASFTDEPFTLKLDLICRSIGVKYEVVNDQVTITGNGCK